MISTLFQNGQRIILQVLDWAQTAWQTVFENRVNDYSQAGICHGELSEFLISAGTNNTPTTPSVTIGDGAAYDISANRIFIASTDTTTYNTALPNTTTNDGTGTFISTPFSTGCVNIPLTVNSFNYLWIDYLETIDPTIFTLQDITLAKQFYQGSDGYKITVTTVNIPPTASSIFLGSVNLTGSGVVSSTTISQSGRTYTANLPYRTLIQTPLSSLADRTTVYTLGGTYFADDHTKAIGTGTVGPMNPHGLSPQDIGLAGASTIQFHQEFLHSPGLVGDANNLQAQIVSVIPGFDFILVNPIPADGVITSNGISLTSTDIPAFTTLQFTASDAPGTWYIYVDIVNKRVSRSQTNLIVTPNPNQYLIYTVLYTFPDPDSSNGHLSALTDFRVFGNIATRELQAGSVTGVKINPSALGAGLSKDGSNNVQVNVDGTSIIINGSNQLQANGGGLAGAGLVASGGVLNVNPDNSTINIISNKVEVANSGITGLQLNPSVAGNGLSGGGGSPLSVNVDNSSIIISGDTLSVADGGISTRLHFNLPTTSQIPSNGNLQTMATFSFTVPSSSQPIFVSWTFSCTFTGAPTPSILPTFGIKIDGQPLGYVTSQHAITSGPGYTYPSGYTFTTTPPVVSPLQIIVPQLLVAPGGHSLQFVSGAPSSTGYNVTADVYLEFIYR